MEEQQKFQSKAQLTVLKIHAVVDRIYDVVLFPLTWLAEQFGQTDQFRQREPAPLKVVR